MTQQVKLSLIRYKGYQNDALKGILNSINGYLLRNKGAVSDFNLVKDIVDRNLDKIDDDISNAVPTPLYLGLLGTMCGILIGMLSIPELNADNTDASMNGITMLLSGVSIALVASAFGLLLTIFSNFLFSRARRSVENQKHDFFTFIQTRLLPILSKNTSSSIHTLQTNLLKFNKDFATNMGNFSSTVNDVRHTFDSQLEVVQQLKRIDVAKIAMYNVEVLKELQNSLTDLRGFASYLDNMNGFIGNTRELNVAVNQQLQKVGDLKSIVERFELNAGNVSDNSNYLKSHFKNFDSREQAINDRIASFDKNTGKMIDNLELSFNKRLQQFNEKDVEISSGFDKLFKDLQVKAAEIFEDQSGNIKGIRKDLEKLKNGPSNQNELSHRVEKNDEYIKELLEVVKANSKRYKLSMGVKIVAILMALIVGATCFSMLYYIFFT